MHGQQQRTLDRSETHIVERCIDGEKEAWESLFHRFQPRLISIIKMYLGRGAGGGELAEEIAASVWYSLVLSENARLRRFDSARGARLLTYLAALARQEIRKRYRREQNRHDRETRAARLEATGGDDPRCALLLQEFLGTLTARERAFCLAYLLDDCDEADRPVVSVCNGWQLRSRVLRKLRIFSGEPAFRNQDAI